MPISFDGKSGDFGSCVKHFMGKISKLTGKKHTKQSASKVCGKLQSVQEKEMDIRFCNLPISIKEEGGEFYSEGFLTTTHPDREGQILSKEALFQIKDLINSGKTATDTVGSPMAVSYGHDWVKGDSTVAPAGMAVLPVEIKDTGDGHFGIWAKTHHNKYHPKYEEIIDGVKHGYIPGYSIEFYQGEVHPLTINDKELEVVKSIKDLVGYSFANARKIANPNAKITNFGYKEIEDNLNKEVVKMADEETPKEEAPKEEAPKEEAPKEETPKEEATKEGAVDVKEMVEKHVKKEIENKIKDIKKPMIKETDDNDEVSITLKEMDKCIGKGDALNFKELARPFINAELDSLQKGEKKTLKSNLIVKCVGKGLKIVGGLKLKATLDTATNVPTYTQSSVEFADLFAPGIIDTFNNQTNFLGFLRKEQHIGGYFYQWKMITNKDPDSNDTFVDRDDTTVLKNYSSKYNYQTPLKVARRGVSVTDFSIRYSARSLGDLFQLENDLQMLEMMNDVNASLFAEVADGTGNAPLGLEAVADSTGNTTLYGYTRSTTNRLAAAALANTYQAVGGNLVEATLRGAIDKLIIEGSRKQDVAIIAHPTTRTYLFNLMDTNRRFATTQAAFGFNQLTVPMFDGYPIIEDHDCNSDAIYIIDTSQDVLVMGMEPRLVSLAKVGAATESYLEMHFAHVYKQPRRIHMLDTLNGP